MLRPVPGTKHCYEHQTPQERLATQCSVPGCWRLKVTGSALCEGHRDLGIGVESAAAREIGDEELGAPSTSQRPGPPTTAEDGLWTAAGFVYVVAVLTLAAAVVAGIALILHKDTSCPSNPFDSSVDVACGGATYPFRGAGVAILIGGVVQAGLWFVLARVTHQLSQVRAATRVLLVRSGLGLRGEELD